MYRRYLKNQPRKPAVSASKKELDSGDLLAMLLLLLLLSEGNKDSQSVITTLFIFLCL